MLPFVCGNQFACEMTPSRLVRAVQLVVVIAVGDGRMNKKQKEKKNSGECSLIICFAKFLPRGMVQDQPECVTAAASEHPRELIYVSGA